MGNLTQTTAQVQTDLDAVEASNAGLTSITDLSDTTATAAKKSGFHSLQASSSNAPSTDRAVMISAVRNTSASSQIRYGQVLITESNGLWFNSDNNGTLGTWSQVATVNTAQTISGAKTITGNMTFNSATLDANGNELILDADGDTSITADTDDQIDVKIAGADDFQFTANTFTALSGSTIKANTIAETTAASGVTIDGVLVKDSTVKTGTLTVGAASITDSSGSISFGNENLTTTGTLAAGVATLATGSTVGNLTLANGSITDSSGTISFGNENLTTSGNITTTAGDLTVSTGDVSLTNGKLTIATTSATSTGVRLDGYHNSASPAIADTIFNLRVLANDDGLTQSQYGAFAWFAQNVGAGAEGANWHLQQAINGTLTTVLNSTSAGSIAVPVGNLTVDTGDLTLTAGSLTLSSGSLDLTGATGVDNVAVFRSTDAGAYIKLEDDSTTTGVTSVAIGVAGDDLLLRAGNVNHVRLFGSTGNATMYNGSLTLSTGDLTVSTGDVDIASGSLMSSGSGGLTVTSGDGAFFGNATGGAVIRGYGSTNDINIQNRSNQSALRVPTGTTNVVMDTGDLIITTPTTPASASATGTVGTIAWDSNYMYVCVATNTWKRAALSTW